MGIQRGPNVNLLDAVEPIRDSPLYSSWRLPIPPEWYSANRRAFTLVDQDALYGSLLYARSYGRTSSDTLSGPTDQAAVVALGRFRAGTDVVTVPGESVATARTFTRTASESVGAPTEGLRSIRNQGALVHPIVDRWP